MKENENINAVINEVQKFLSEVNVDGKDTVRIRSAIEEALLNYQEFLGILRSILAGMQADHSFRDSLETSGIYAGCGCYFPVSGVVYG